MGKRVLDVGQCGPDHTAIRGLMETFGASVERVARPVDALDLLRRGSYDLVLVNRKIDLDYSDGTELIRAMQSDENLRTVPVMLVSNYAQAQSEAVKLGAVRGFGKTALGSADTRDRLAAYLS